LPPPNANVAGLTVTLGEDDVTEIVAGEPGFWFRAA
jgi:hypothetical protein